MNKYLGNKVPKCGAMDSKYFSHPEQFDKDIQQHRFDSELSLRAAEKYGFTEPAICKCLKGVN